MRYLCLSMIIIALSCRKYNDKPLPPKDIPTILAIDISSQLVDTVVRPKFTFTLNVPDTSIVEGLYVYQVSSFPYAPAGGLYNLKSGKFSVIDLKAFYPPSKPIKYFSVFGFKDGTFVTNDTFELK